MNKSDLLHHRINYIEFSVTDIQAAKDFYNRAFDWQFTDYAPTYVGIVGEHAEAGGFCLVEEVITGGPLIVLYSNDLKASLQKVLNAGGRIIKEIFDFPGGKRFEFLDPSENKLAVWTLNEQA